MAKSKQNSLSDENLIKLADFTIFMMKLMKRLEMQSHNNLTQNTSLQKKVASSEYQLQRKALNAFQIPPSPEEFLQILRNQETKNTTKNAIEESFMPNVL